MCVCVCLACVRGVGRCAYARMQVCVGFFFGVCGVFVRSVFV